MKHRLRLTATHLMNCGDLPPLCLIDQSHGAVSIQLLPQPLRPYDISLLDPVIVLRIFELERYNAEVHKILPADTGIGRSEEHTSELQSRGQLVFRLLLENKNRILE